MLTKAMNLTEEVWQEKLDEALHNAQLHERSDVAEYISLKASNDAIRARSVKWLLETVSEIVFAFNTRGARIKLEQTDNHRFSLQKAHLTGSRLKLQYGIRCLTLEAGWTRNPGDGFMRGGALVFARISHFGFPKEAEELVLLKYENQPQWFSVDGEFHRISFDVRSLKKHFEVFLGD